MSEHEFEIGNLVSIVSRRYLSPATPLQFIVETKLPDRDGVPQYRIVNIERKHERVELGSNLMVVNEMNTESS